MIRTFTLRSRAGASLTLAGGILGMEEDAQRVRELLAKSPPDIVLLGVPFEDLDAIRATSGKESTQVFDKDEADDAYLKQLAVFGRVQIPPGDLYAAFAHAQGAGLDVEAVDLGDEGHTAVYTKHVGMFEVMRNNRRLKRLGKEPVTAADPESFAKAWDAHLFPTKGLRQVQVERESWMARRIAERSTGRKAPFALVPLARLEGVRSRLVAEHGFA